MAKYHARDARIYINGYDISALAVGLTPIQERELHPYAVMDGVQGYHQMPGLAKDVLSIDGLFDDNYKTVLDNLWASTTGYQIIIPFGVTQGNRGLAVDAARLSKYNWAAVVTDINKLTAELVAENRPWDEVKLLQPKATKTADGNSASIDDGASSADGAVGYLQVFACGGDDALIVKIQDSPDDSAWSDLITFTTANGITTERATVSGTVDRYVRVLWTGTPTYSATFAVVYKRN